MIAVVRETWIIIGFVVLAVAALVVSAAGWILLLRGRRGLALERAADAEAGNEAQSGAGPGL